MEFDGMDFYSQTTCIRAEKRINLSSSSLRRLFELFNSKAPGRHKFSKRSFFNHISPFSMPLSKERKQQQFGDEISGVSYATFRGYLVARQPNMKNFPVKLLTTLFMFAPNISLPWKFPFNHPPGIGLHSDVKEAPRRTCSTTTARLIFRGDWQWRDMVRKFPANRLVARGMSLAAIRMTWLHFGGDKRAQCVKLFCVKMFLLKIITKRDLVAKFSSNNEVQYQPYIMRNRFRFCGIELQYITITRKYVCAYIMFPRKEKLCALSERKSKEACLCLPWNDTAPKDGR